MEFVLYKKFNSNEFVDPLKVEYFPFVEQKRCLSDIRYNSVTSNYSAVQNVGTQTISTISKASRGIYYSSLFFVNPMIVLLTQSRHILEIGRFFARNDKESILLKFQSSHIVPKKINYAIDLFNSGEVDRAIKILNELDTELEKLNETDERINLITIRAQFEAREGRFLLAAFDMIVAASLVESTVTVSETLEAGEVSHINAKGKYYYSAVMLLRKYIYMYGVNDDLVSAFKRFSEKAQAFFEYEANYRERNGIHVTGFYDLKVVKIPKISLGKDSKSVDLNRLLASNIEKLQCQIDDCSDVGNLLNAIKTKEYKKNPDEIYIVDILESIDMVIEKEFSVLDGDIEAIRDFYNFCFNKLDISIKEQISLSQCRFKLFINDSDGALSDFFDAYESSDCEEINDVMFLFEKIRANFKLDIQKDMMNKVLQHENAQHIQPNIVSFYRQLVGIGADTDDYLVKSFYPTSDLDFANSVGRIESGEHHIRYNNEIIQIDTLSLRALLGMRQYHVSENRSDASIQRIDFSILTSDKYKKYLPEGVAREFKLEKSSSLNETIRDVCELFYNIEGLGDVRKRIERDKIKLGVFGVISVGKSTFVNALISNKILGVDKRIATNVKTSIVAGDRDCAEIIYSNGDREFVDLSNVTNYTTEQKNPCNTLKVERVVVQLRDISIPLGVEIVDIPGMGAYEHEHEFHLRGVESELGEVDCVLMLVQPDDALDTHTINFIKQAVNEKRIPFLLLVNKSEDISQDDKEDIRESIYKKFEAHMVETSNLGFYFISSEMALGGRLSDDDILDYFTMGSSECIAESGFLEVEKKLFENIVPYLKKQKQVSILERAVFELEISKNSDEHLVQDSLSILELEDGQLYDDYVRLEKLLHQIDSPIKFHSLGNDLLQRFDLIEPEVLIHQISFDRDKVSAFSSNMEVYNVLHEPIYNSYLIQRNKYIDIFYEDVKTMINIEIDRVNLKSKIFHADDFSHIGELNCNFDSLASSSKIGNFFSRILNKDNVIKEAARIIIGEIIEKDKNSYSRLLNEEISRYAYFYRLVESRVETLKETMVMNEHELKALIDQLNSAITKKRLALEMLRGVKDEL